MANQKILIPKSLWITYAIFVIIPWISFDKIHLILFNFEHHRFELMFQVYQASTHQLIYIVFTIFISLLLGLNFTLSRFFCGYFCPSSLSHLITQKFENVFIGSFMVVIFSFLLGLASVGYFCSVYSIVFNFLDFNSCTIFVLILSSVFVGIFLIFRSWYCSILCPYFFVSSILPQENKQIFEFTNKENCIECEKCVKNCPIENLDIKSGFDIRCIQCGLCEIECQDIMSRLKKDSLIKLKFTNRKLWNSFSRNGIFYIIAFVLICLIIVNFILDVQFLDFCYIENKGFLK